MKEQLKNVDIGEHLRSARESIGLTQAELAAESGFEVSAITDWETGRRSPTITNLLKLSFSLRVTAGSLLSLVIQEDEVNPECRAAFDQWKKSERLGGQTLDAFEAGWNARGKK